MYATDNSSPRVPGPRASNSSDESVLMCLRMSSALIESSAGLSSAGKFAACVVAAGVACVFVWLFMFVVTQAPAVESRSASARRAKEHLFIVCFASLFGREVCGEFRRRRARSQLQRLRAGASELQSRMPDAC